MKNTENFRVETSGLAGRLFLPWLRWHAEHPLESRVGPDLVGLVVRLRLRLALLVGGRHVERIANDADLREALGIVVVGYVSEWTDPDEIVDEIIETILSSLRERARTVGCTHRKGAGRVAQCPISTS